MKTLNGTITDKAEASWTGGKITDANFKSWFDHWIKTGEDWHKELAAEGLTLTAAKVLDLVEFTQKTRGNFEKHEKLFDDSECIVSKRVERDNAALLECDLDDTANDNSEDFELPKYSDIGRALVRVTNDGGSFGKFSYEVIDSDGCTFWINEGVGFDYWLEHEVVFDSPGVYLIEGIVGHYYRGTWGFDDDDETWEFKSVTRIGLWQRIKWWWRGTEGELE